MLTKENGSSSKSARFEEQSTFSQIEKMDVTTNTDVIASDEDYSAKTVL